MECLVCCTGLGKDATEVEVVLEKTSVTGHFCDSCLDDLRAEDWITVRRSKVPIR